MFARLCVPSPVKALRDLQGSGCGLQGLGFRVSGLARV